MAIEYLLPNQIVSIIVRTVMAVEYLLPKPNLLRVYTFLSYGACYLIMENLLKIFVKARKIAEYNRVLTIVLKILLYPIRKHLGNFKKMTYLAFKKDLLIISDRTLAVKLTDSFIMPLGIPS